MNPQSSEATSWKDRYAITKIRWAKAARRNPHRAAVVMDKTSEWLQLYAVDMQNGRFTQLTDKKGGVSADETAFSADGNYIYTLNDNKGDEVGHLVRIPFSGGEMEDLTPDMPKYAVRGIGTSLDGQRIGFVAVNSAGFHLYAIDNLADEGISKPKLIYQDKFEFWQAELSANGRFIGIISTRKTKTRLYSVVIFDTQTGEEVAELWDGVDTSVTLTCFSPTSGDDRMLGVSSKLGQKRPFLWNPITNSRTDFDFPEIEGDVLAWDWSNDGSHLLLCHSYRTEQQLYTFNLQTNTLSKLNHSPGVYERSIGPFGTFAHFLPNNNIAALWQSGTQPAQFAELDGITGEMIRVILGSETAVSAQPWQSITYTSSDGTPIQGWLAVPEGDGPFPTILNMHGGPHYQKRPIFDPDTQAWLDHGFALLSINFRGSTGFGDEFKSQIWGNLGHWELEDMVAAHHWLVENCIARANAIFLNGMSYGGYLTLWGLARRPDLWAGGLAAVAIADWATNYEDATDAMKGAFRMWHGGSPTEVEKRYVNSSPATFLENISAPLLVIQGHNDTRTTPRQMAQFEARMKALDKQIEVLWFDAGHGEIGVVETIAFHQKQIEFALSVLKQKG